MRAVLKNGNLIWINGAGFGYKKKTNCEYIPIPEQDVSSLFQLIPDSDPREWEFTGTNDDITWEFPVADLPHSEHIGKLISVNPANAKPAVVRRKYLGQDYDVSCLVSQNVVDMWQANKLDVNDWVLVSFIDEILDTEEKNIAIVIDKIYNSWT